MDGRTETAQPRADDLVDPEGGGGFAMDFGDEEYAAELDAYPVAATRSAGFEPQQHAEAYANDPWFSSTDSYATNNYVPEEEPAEAAGKEQGQTELDAYKNLHNNAHNSTENTHYGYGANGYTGEGNNVRSPGPVPHPIQHQPIEPFVDRKDSIASITSIPPPKASDNYVPLIPENAAAIPINGGVGVPATYGRRRSSTALSNTVTSPKAQPITLQQAAGHVMFGSNMSIPTIQEAPGSNGISHQQISHSNIQQPASYNSNIIGFGSDQDLSLTHQESWVSTNLVASYKWTIENFHSITDEKIVSPPFGSLDHPWQMVVYPRGAHNDQVYLSAFLRPLKTLPEVTAADDWERSVRRFTMRVHKPASDINGYTLYSSTEPEETFSYTIPPSHQPTGPDGEYVLPDDVLLQDTSLETEFGGFSHSVPGWGFTNLMHLDEFLPVAVDAQSGSLILSASVESTVTVPCHTQSFSWAIPQLAEHTSRSGTLQSPAFGPPACPWTIQLRVDADASLLGGFLQPVLTAGELVYPRWTRAISSFTLKIQSPQGEFGYTHSPAHVNVKTLTGGFVFRDGSESTGWPGLLALDQVSGCADSEGTVRLDVEVTWAGRDVPAVGGDVVVAGAGDVAASGVSEAELARQLQEMELVWDARVRSTELERDSFAGKAASLEEEVIAASDAISKEVERVKQVKAELDASRETESELGSMKLKVSQAKAKIAALRAYFEDGAILRKHQDGLLHVYSPHDKESNMFLLKSQIANLEAELESAREVIRQNHNTMFDMKLFPGSQRPGSPPMGHARRMSVMSESPEGAISVQDALENGRAELENARQSLDDFAHRGDYSPDAGGQLVERSAFRADIGMVFAELSLACASLLDSAYHLEPEQLPTFDRGSTVALLAAEMEELLLSVEAQLSQLRLPFSAYGYATSQSFSPVSASQRLSQSVGREVELQVERLRMQNEMLQEELKGYKRREQNPFDVSDPAFIQSMMSSPTMRQGLTKSVSVSQLAKGRGDVYPEPWTPVDVHGGPVSAVELAKILSQLETSKKQSLFSALFVTAFLLITSFMSYAALNVHCTATLHADSLLCATAVPIAASLSNAWHTAAERFVIDVVPATSGAVGVVQKQALRAMDQRERRVKLERDRMERERVERERLAQVVVEQEEALRLRAAAAEKEQMEKLERWEAEKAAEFAKREREMRERFEAEQVRAKRELEELKVAKEREIQEIRAMALKDREYVPEPNDTVQSDNVSPENADDEVNVRLAYPSLPSTFVESHSAAATNSIPPPVVPLPVVSPHVASPPAVPVFVPAVTAKDADGNSVRSKVAEDIVEELRETKAIPTSSEVMQDAVKTKTSQTPYGEESLRADATGEGGAGIYDLPNAIKAAPEAEVVVRSVANLTQVTAEASPISTPAVNASTAADPTSFHDATHIDVSVSGQAVMSEVPVISANFNQPSTSNISQSRFAERASNSTSTIAAPTSTLTDPASSETKSEMHSAPATGVTPATPYTPHQPETDIPSETTEPSVTPPGQMTSVIISTPASPEASFKRAGDGPPPPPVPPHVMFDLEALTTPHVDEVMFVEEDGLAEVAGRLPLTAVEGSTEGVAVPAESSSAPTEALLAHIVNSSSGESVLDGSTAVEKDITEEKMAPMGVLEDGTEVNLEPVIPGERIEDEDKEEMDGHDGEREAEQDPSDPSDPKDAD